MKELASARGTENLKELHDHRQVIQGRRADLELSLPFDITFLRPLAPKDHPAVDRAPKAVSTIDVQPGVLFKLTMRDRCLNRVPWLFR